MHALKPQNAKTKKAHNGGWKFAWYKIMKVNAETEDNGDWKSEDIKQWMLKQKASSMVTKKVIWYKTN